jgi:uncharacterized protein (UPF0261 family)
MKTVGLVGTLDTKGVELSFAAEHLRTAGLRVLLIDISTDDTSAPGADVSARQVAAAGGHDLDDLRTRVGRAERQAAMIAGAGSVLAELLDRRQLHAVMALGGSNNTSMAAAVFRELPIGLPKLILTTMIGADVGRFVGGSDLIIAPSVVDIAGLNRLSRMVITNAAAAVAGMVERGAAAETTDGLRSAGDHRPVVACSMIGLTSTAVSAARAVLDHLGYEAVVFHMTGRGGQAMERFIDSGAVDGVLDLTTSELADEAYGGICSAGPGRLRGAARRGLPQVVAPGGLDMINFGPPETVPDHLRGRRLQYHNAQVTLVRTTPAECAALGTELVARLSAAPTPGSVTPPLHDRPVLLLPADGLSAIDRPGGPFHDPAATEALTRAALERADPDRLEVVQVPGDLDSVQLGQRAAELLHTKLASRMATSPSGS